MTKEQILATFDPSQPGAAQGQLFGLPFSADQSEIVVVPAPWEATVSYGSGASDGPEAVLEASYQVDLHHQKFPDLWKLGIHYDNENAAKWKSDSDRAKELAQNVIEALESGKNLADFPELESDLAAVNQASEQFNQEVENRCAHWLGQNKLVGFLGGDHATPYGYYKALAAKFGSFGILHLDAHMDLRIAYEGFTYSHASIMYNTLQLPEVEKLVQVGIRDFCEQEVSVARKHQVVVFTDTDMKEAAFAGTTWREQCDQIIAELPQRVVISFDIDGMYPWYCPNTGTPVPGGFSFEQAAYLLSEVVHSGRELIGFDLVEVAPGDDDWDGNVGARMLFNMCGLLAKANGKPVGEPIKFQ